jgi:hypothetical protein
MPARILSSLTAAIAEPIRRPAGLRRCLLRLRLTRLVVRDEPTHGGDYLLPCRLGSALRAARDVSLRL